MAVFRSAVDAVLTLPLVLPPTVIGYYLLVLLGRRGWLGSFLADWGIVLVFTWQGAVIAATVVAFPMVLKAARAAFQGVDPALETGAPVLGVRASGTFFRVTRLAGGRGGEGGLYPVR